MADRYWVGGTDTWDATAGTKWALTSGGAGGEAVPIASDDVFFDANSGAVTVTVTGTRPCRTLICTGFTGTIDGSGTLRPRRDVLLVPGMTWSFTGQLNLLANSTSSPITTAGKVISNITIEANGATNGFQLQDALTVSGDIDLQSGVFDLNGQTLSCLNFSSPGTDVRTLSLGSSIVNIGNDFGGIWDCSSSANLSLVGSGYTINGFGPVSFLGGGLSYDNVIISVDRGIALFGNIGLQNTNTFSSLSLYTSGGASNAFLTDNQTITGNLTLSGDPSGNLSIAGSFSTPKTVTCNGVVIASYTTFSYISAAGAASWVVSTGSGNVDGGNNTGITFIDGSLFSADSNASLSADSIAIFPAAYSVPADSDIVWDGQALSISSLNVSASSLFQSVGRSDAAATFTISPEATFTVSGRGAINAVASILSVANLSAIGVTARKSVASIAAAAVYLATGKSLNNSAYSVSADSEPLFTGSALTSSVLTVSSQAILSATGASDANSWYDISAQGDITYQGRSFADGLAIFSPATNTAFYGNAVYNSELNISASAGVVFTGVMARQGAVFIEAAASFDAGGKKILPTPANRILNARKIQNDLYAGSLNAIFNAPSNKRTV